MLGWMATQEALREHALDHFDSSARPPPAAVVTMRQTVLLAARRLEAARLPAQAAADAARRRLGAAQAPAALSGRLLGPASGSIGSSSACIGEASRLMASADRLLQTVLARVAEAQQQGAVLDGVWPLLLRAIALHRALLAAAQPPAARSGPALVGLGAGTPKIVVRFAGACRACTAAAKAAAAAAASSSARGAAVSASGGDAAPEDPPAAAEAGGGGGGGVAPEDAAVAAEATAWTALRALGFAGACDLLTLLRQRCKDLDAVLGGYSQFLSVTQLLSSGGDDLAALMHAPGCGNPREVALVLASWLLPALVNAINEAAAASAAGGPSGADEETVVAALLGAVLDAAQPGVGPWAQHHAGLMRGAAPEDVAAMAAGTGTGLGGAHVWLTLAGAAPKAVCNAIATAGYAAGQLRACLLAIEGPLSAAAAGRAPRAGNGILAVLADSAASQLWDSVLAAGAAAGAPPGVMLLALPALADIGRSAQLVVARLEAAGLTELVKWGTGDLLHAHIGRAPRAPPPTRERLAVHLGGDVEVADSATIIMKAATEAVFALLRSAKAPGAAALPAASACDAAVEPQVQRALEALAAASAGFSTAWAAAAAADGAPAAAAAAGPAAAHARRGGRAPAGGTLPPVGAPLYWRTLLWELLVLLCPGAEGRFEAAGGRGSHDPQLWRTLHLTLRAGAMNLAGNGRAHGRQVPHARGRAGRRLLRRRGALRAAR